MEDIIRIEELVKLYPVIRRGIFRSKQVGVIRAVDNITFSIRRGETLGLVGESGCGKSTTARTMLYLTDPTSGSAIFDGTDILQTFKQGNKEEVLKIRRRLQYVFQDPYLSLNPRWSIAETIFEPFRVHRHLPENQWEDRMMELLGMRS